MHKLSGNFRTEWFKSPLRSEYNLLKQVSVQNILYEKVWSLDPLYDKKKIYTAFFE